MRTGREAMAAFDLKVRTSIVAAYESGLPYDAAVQKVKAETFDEYIRILSEYSELPVYPVQQPAPHVGSVRTA